MGPRLRALRPPLRHQGGHEPARDADAQRGRALQVLGEGLQGILPEGSVLGAT